MATAPPQTGSCDMTNEPQACATGIERVSSVLETIEETTATDKDAPSRQGSMAKGREEMEDCAASDRCTGSPVEQSGRASDDDGGLRKRRNPTTAGREEDGEVGAPSERPPPDDPCMSDDASSGDGEHWTSGGWPSSGWPFSEQSSNTPSKRSSILQRIASLVRTVSNGDVEQQETEADSSRQRQSALQRRLPSALTIESHHSVDAGSLGGGTQQPRPPIGRASTSPHLGEHSSSHFHGIRRAKSEISPKRATGASPTASSDRLRGVGGTLSQTATTVTNLFSMHQTAIADKFRKTFAFGGDTADDGEKSPLRRASEDPSARHLESAQECNARLEHIRRGDVHNDIALEEEFDALLFYKNRYVTGRLLHHAIWLDAKNKDHNASCVQAVLRAKADPHGKASYIKESKRNELRAIHIAAGVGWVPVLTALLEHAEDKVEFVNTHCLLEDKPFYYPIHDAAYLGNTDAVVWLLEKRADASKPNKDGYTCLHWLAQIGGEPESDLEVMVKELLKHKARLDVRTNPGSAKPSRIPLEIAASDDSLYPRRLVHLLAPSVQTTSAQEASVGSCDEVSSATTASEYCFFDDMCVLSGLNTDAAGQLATYLVETDDPGCRRKVRIDAQKDNAVDRMANLFHMAPQAAAEMLDLLLVKPKVADPGRHPIRSRAKLGSIFGKAPMRCAYQADTVEKDGVRWWPVWRYNSQKRDDRELKNQRDIAWHLALIQVPEQQDQRQDMDDVDTKVLLLPNVVDVDIFMALSFTAVTDINIFGKLAVQGVIYCVWDHMLRNIVYTQLLFDLAELIVQASWGITRLPGDAPMLSPVNAPFAWSIMLACCLRDMINVVWQIAAHLKKYRGHYQEFCDWQKLAKDTDQSDSRQNQEGKPESTPSREMHQAGSTESTPASDAARIEQAKVEGSGRELGTNFKHPPSLHCLWRPRRLLLETPVVPNCCYLAFKFLFLLRVAGRASGTMMEAQQGHLASITLIHAFRMIYMLRITGVGKKITTIVCALCSGAIYEIYLVTVLFFGSVYLAFTILLQKPTCGSMGLYFYRGLIFGDGDGLDHMGMKGEDDPPLMTGLMVFATATTSIVIMNLVTAVYSSEYDTLDSQSDLRFQKERATYFTQTLLSLQKLRLRGGEETWIRTSLAKSTVVAFGLGVAIHRAVSQPGPVLCVVSAGLLAFLQVAVQAVLMESAWFPKRTDDREGPEREHFLWICHRSGHGAENTPSSDDGRADVSEEVNDRLRKLVDVAIGRQAEQLHDGVEPQVRRLDDKIANLRGDLDKISGQLAQSTGQLERKIDALADQVKLVLDVQMELARQHSKQ